MNKIDKVFESITYGLLTIMLVLMPFSTFLLQLIRFNFEHYGVALSDMATMLFTGWKEIILVILALIVLLRTILLKRLPIKITALDIWLIVFSLIFIVVGGLIIQKPTWIIFGIRYDLEVFFFYFLARTVIKERDDVSRLIKLLLYLSIPVFIFGILQTLVLPQNFLERFGYSWNMIATGNPLPPYHLVFDDVVRAMSTFAGPNSLAMYASFIFLLSIFLGWGNLSKGMNITVLCVSFLTLVLTFSRGHLGSLMLALFLGWIVFKFLYKKVANLYKVAAYVTMMVVVILMGITSVTMSFDVVASKTTGILAQIIDRPGSSDIHKEVREQAWEGIKSKPFGHGLGTAGLATTNTKGIVFNPESWYVQVVYELGWLSLPLVVGLIYFLVLTILGMQKKFIDPSDRKMVIFLFIALLEIIFSANFLPCWFEVGSLIWWILFGLVCADYLNTFPPKKILE